MFAVTGETVILNDQARSILDPMDQAAVLAHAGESLMGDRRRRVHVELPSGAHATLSGRPVGQQPGSRGAVVHVNLGPTPVPQRPTLTGRPQLPVPGLVGSDPVWLRACREVEAASQSGQWLALSGERGVGKLALLQALQLRHHPIRRIEVLDAAHTGTDAGWSGSLRRILDPATRGLIITHVDALDGGRLRELTSALDDARRCRRANAKTPRWVAVTLSQVSPLPELAALMSLFPTTANVPPLRLHLGDVPALVSFFLGRLGPGEQLTCSPEAMATLSRGTWPGNAQEVLDTLREVVRRRRSGIIQLDDLPPAARTVNRRRLNPLETIHRDAIVHALADADGDKTRAALALGMSRATIYRKIQDFGVIAAPA